MNASALSDLIRIRGRFQRSVQLARDWREQRALEDYLLTPTAKELAGQVLAGAYLGGTSRSWSITGPYGSGKSAFALFLTDLLVNEPPRHTDARLLLQSASGDVRRFIPVLIVGQRDSLVPSLLESLRNSFTRLDEDLCNEIDHALGSSTSSDRDAVQLFERAAICARNSGFGGLLIIIDEFGKFLEYAAHHPRSEDLLVMQDLAELAARSETPILLITVLHSAFAEYLSVLDETRRMEWRKVQGRFADIAFLEPPEQFLRLAGAAIEWRQHSGTESEYRQHVEDLLKAMPFEEVRRRFPVDQLLPDCAPLHPITALLLWPLFRSKLAQNERSLFAFLMDRGPYGFQEFLNLSSLGDSVLQFYEVDRLYDYVVGSLGPAVFLGDRSRRWASIEFARDRIAADSPPLAEAIVKAIGILNLYGPAVGLQASRSTLEIAFHDAEEVSAAIEYLENASIIIYRRYEDAYALWEGSDVDLDATYEEALRHVSKDSHATRLKRSVELQPVVAKAHYIRKGTLRFFTVDVIDGSSASIGRVFEKASKSGDGRLVFVLTTDAVQRRDLIKLATELTVGTDPVQQLRFFAFPDTLVGVGNALEEVEAWVWIVENVPALQGDPVARQEVRTRLTHARRQLLDIAGPVLGLNGYLFDPSLCHWVQGGKQYQLRTASQFQRWLSRCCDAVYHAAPSFHNELLNRENISSAATSARRLLLEAMIEHESEAQLNISGTPAEYSMYRSLLEAGGYHQQTEGNWRFGAPGSDWQAVWSAMVEFLDSTSNQRRPLIALHKILKSPPFGLREGPIPVLVAVLMLSRRDEIALYEDGLFVPTLRIEVFERFTRVPENFEIQQYRFDQTTREAFNAVGAVLENLQLASNLGSSPDLIRVIRPLVVFAARLPEYTKRTNRVSPPTAIEVRDLLLNARDPHKLLFEDLPRAVQVEIKGQEAALEFAEQLKIALAGLQRSYSALLDVIERHIRNLLVLDGSSQEAKRQLQRRATPLVGFAGDRTLSLFVKEASQFDGRDWREVLARVVNKGVPPTHWADHDVVDFQVRLRRLASDFVRLEELVSEQERSGASQILRLGVLDGRLEEAREIISVPPDREVDVDSLVARIRTVLQESNVNGQDGRRVRLAALTKVAQEYLSKNGDGTNE